jgi:hypothetical protein
MSPGPLRQEHLRHSGFREDACSMIATTRTIINTAIRVELLDDRSSVCRANTLASGTKAKPG